MYALSRRKFLAAGAGLAASAWLPRSLYAEAPAAGVGINPFATDLYGELSRPAGNVFLSPYSLSTALAMTAAGARGNTLDQMRKVLHLPADDKASDAAYASLAKDFDGADKGFQISVANALWALPGYPWSGDYRKRVTDTFKAGIHDANFATNPDECRKTINSWVEKQTKEKIKDLIPAGVIDSLTRLVLTNAIYFKGDWLTAFDKKLTKDLPFTMLDGSKKDVPLMHRSGSIDYAENGNVQAIRLPYKGKEISFLAALPKNPALFESLDSNLDNETLKLWTKELKPAPKVQVWLPRFKVEAQYTLNDALKKLGMPEAFDFKKADFSGMVTSLPEGKLAITAVVHKAFVDVNEEGTEAAAGSGVVVGVRSAPAPAEPKIFRADRPFLFALRHEPTGTILFLGRYSKV